MFLNAEKIYDLLIKNKITESKGTINFSFLNVSVNIQEKSAIGDLFQEWLAKWMTSNQIEYRTHSNTQEFPDFLLDRQSNKHNLLEQVDNQDWLNEVAQNYLFHTGQNL